METTAIEEIVVTANKRSEPISKVSASLMALSQAQMERQGIREVQDLVSAIPGLSFSQNTGYNTANSTVSIRGIVSRAGAATTGVYIDDTPIQAIGDIENFLGSSFPKVFDLERVEVLRGPQGTLFGAGAEGGVVRFITPKPSLTAMDGYARGEVSATQGGGLSYETGAAVGGPILQDELGFRASLWTRHDGGYTDRRAYTTGLVDHKPDYSDSLVTRLALTVAPAEGLTVTPSIYYQRTHANDQSSYWTALSDPGRGRFERGNAIRVRLTDSFTLASLATGYDLPGMKLTSVTSNFQRAGRTPYDLTNVLAPLLIGNFFPTVPDHAYFDRSEAITRQRIWTEEARLQSTDTSARLRWVGGLFVQSLKQTDGETTFNPYLDELLTDALGAPANLNLLNGVSAFATRQEYTLVQVSGFGSLDYKVSETITATMGLRITRSRLDIQDRTDGPFTGLSTIKGRIAESPVTPKFALSWQATPDALYYASAAKGYRIGGVNVPAPLSLCAQDLAAVGLKQTPTTYQSDSTWSYEIGAKNRLYEGRVQYELSAYHIDWRGVQLLTALNCGFGYVLNAGAAASNGVDLTAHAQLGRALTLGLAVGYDDARYTQTVRSGAGVIAEGHAAVGNPNTGDVISPWALSLTFQYDLPIHEEFAPYIWAEYDFHSRNPGPFTSQTPTAAAYDPTIPADPATHLVKLRAGARVSEVELSVFVDNLLNSHPQIGLQHAVVASPVYSATTFRPRTIGVNAAYRF